MTPREGAWFEPASCDGGDGRESGLKDQLVTTTDSACQRIRHSLTHKYQVSLDATVGPQLTWNRCFMGDS
jgi:hypothetical protein